MIGQGLRKMCNIYDRLNDVLISFICVMMVMVRATIVKNKFVENGFVIDVYKFIIICEEYFNQ